MEDLIIHNMLKENKQFILFLIGIPASGKSTYAKLLCESFCNIKRINKDDLRSLTNKQFSRELEAEILNIERKNGIKILSEGNSLVVDDTNISKKHYNYWKNVANTLNIPIFVKIFQIDLSKAIKRDFNRPTKVGESVIRSMYESLNKKEWIINLKENILE